MGKKEQINRIFIFRHIKDMSYSTTAQQGSLHNLLKERVIQFSNHCDVHTRAVNLTDFD